MRFRIWLALVLVATGFAQNASKPAVEPKFATVPITLDHDRVIIDVYIPQADGTSKRVRGWVDNGTPEMWMSRRVAAWMGLAVNCDGQVCSAKPSQDAVLQVVVGGMKVLLHVGQKIQVASGSSAIGAGMSAEINLPSSVLRNYDVIVDFPQREFSIGQPGSLQFKGVKSKMLVNAENGLVQISSKIENKNYNLALDVGSSFSFLAGDLFEKLAAAHTDWPHMTGAIGPANMWGEKDEPSWKLMRVNRVQYGSLYLVDVAVAESAKDRTAFFEKRAGIPTAGLLGSSSLLNYRIGLDYAHSAVYFEVGSTFKFPEFDVIGLILRPEEDGRFTIVGVADFEGKPSVEGVQAGDHLAAVDDIPVPGSTMGQVWSMLEGSPGQERKLTIEREGKQFTVAGTVRHFLGVTAEDSKGSKKK